MGGEGGVIAPCLEDSYPRVHWARLDQRAGEIARFLGHDESPLEEREESLARVPPAMWGGNPGRGIKEEAAPPTPFEFRFSPK